MPDVDEKTFEQSMAEMAIAALKSKAPSLVEYVMGFQLLDKNDDDTRAVGFFGFKVGERWVYGPVFFLNGEIKGLEMMYAKDEDKMLPLEEGWIAYLTKKRDFTLGENQEKDRTHLSLTGPDLRPYNRPPNFKISAERESFILEMVKSSIGAGSEKVADWAKDVVGPMRDVQLGEWPERLRLPKLAADLGITRPFLNDCRTRPKLGQAVLSMYDSQEFIDALSTTKTAALIEKTPDVGKVMILDSSNVEKDRGRARFMSDSDKEQIMRGNTVVVDDRLEREKRRVFKYEGTLKLENPKEGGMYDMLTSDGGMKKVMILIPRVVGHGAARDVRIVIDTENGNYILAPTTSIYVSHQYERSEFKDELEDLSGDLEDYSFDTQVKPGEADWDPAKRQEGYAIMCPNGEVICPFTVHQQFENTNATKTLLVEPSSLDLMAIDKIQREIRERGRIPVSGKRRGGSISNSMPFDGVLFDDAGITELNSDGSRDYQVNPAGSWEANRRMRIILTPKPLKKPMANGQSLLVPTGAGCRVMKIKPTESELDPATTADMYLGIEKMAEVLKVYDDGHRYHLTFDHRTKTASTDREVLEVLMKEAALGEEDARIVLQESRRLKTAQCSRYWVEKLPEQEKVAVPFDEVFGVSRSDPMIDALIQESVGEQEMRPPEYESPTKPEVYRHHKDENNYHAVYQKDIEQINQAAQSGQKDVFDAAALGSLINVQNVDEEIESYLGDMIQGLDKLGRTLFLIYWHNEDLQERYGKQELADLEDSVKSGFQQLGEVVLDLKKKSPVDTVSFGRGLL